MRNVTKMKSGSLLVECYRQQQSINLLSATTILETEISATPHRTLNYSKGIIRDRDRTLIELPEEEICQELKPQGITNVKIFSIKKQGTIIKLNTYLLTFESPSFPNTINVGPYRMKVDQIQLAVFYAKSLVMESSHVEVTPNVTDVRRKATMA